VSPTPPPLKPALDREALQAVVLQAAAAGDAPALARLPALATALDEPYRTAAGEVLRLRKMYGFADAAVLGAALQTRPLYRLDAGGRKEELSAEQAANLVFGGAWQPGQAAAYADLLQAELEQRRREELKSRVQSLAAEFADDPGRLLEELGKAVSASAASRSAADRRPTELMELIPYARSLEEEQTGSEFQGLDSGFPHVNHLCNGLDAGLFVVAARPGEGKTTLVWQVCCQAAGLNQTPVIFVSYEQSKKELRAKALARLAKLPYRHVLRGKLKAGDAEVWARVLQALDEYALIAQHLTVVEADEFTTTEAIRELAAAKMALAGAGRCLVAVDYLQVVPPSVEDSGRITSPRDRIDLQVSALRRLGRDLNASVLAISSENRSGYGSSRLDVFKESGGIEYSADVAAVLTRDRKSPAPAQGEYRVEDLNVVKNRNGECGVVKFKFYARRAEFVETEKADLPAEAEE
jgi:replicative DNA helicase